MNKECARIGLEFVGKMRGMEGKRNLKNSLSTEGSREEVGYREFLHQKIEFDKIFVCPHGELTIKRINVALDICLLHL